MQVNKDRIPLTDNTIIEKVSFLWNITYAA